MISKASVPGKLYSAFYGLSGVMVFSKNMTTHMSCSQLRHGRGILFLPGLIYPAPPSSCSWPGKAPLHLLLCAGALGHGGGEVLAGGPCLLPPQPWLPPFLLALPSGLGPREYAALVTLGKLQL